MKQFRSVCVDLVVVHLLVGAPTEVINEVGGHGNDADGDEGSLTTEETAVRR